MREAFITSQGKIDASLSHVTVSVTLQLNTQTLKNGKVVPSFKVLKQKVEIPKDHIHISIHGDVFAKIADWLKGFFLDTVRHDIENAMTDAIKHQLPPQINELT